MATTGFIGPDAAVRVDGKGEHDLMSIELTKSKPKTPVIPIGYKEVRNYTTQAATAISWSGEVVAGSTGAFAVDWDDLLDNNKVVSLVFQTAGRKDTLSNVTVDELGMAYSAEDGRLTRSISGQAGKHSYA